MGAVLLDGGIHKCDRIFAQALFGSDPELHETWTELKHHPLQLQSPTGDRHWIREYKLLLKLTEFEKQIGIEFKHIRLLARAFTDRSIGFNNLTLGSNQRMEFLGDTVLQLSTSDFLYKHFPDYHEGHLSLLRSSLVNNRTQSVVCDDLGMIKFALYANPKAEIKVKDKADLLEALLGALYVDKDLRYCQVFANVCFFPRLQQFILNQDWNDPKSKLQQCCLTLRTMDGGEPDIPQYKIIECKGPTNTRVYTVAVYFRGERLAKAHGHSIQQAEMNAAKLALETCAHLFPHLNYQKRIMERSFKRQGVVTDTIRETWRQETLKKRQELGLDKPELEVKQEKEDTESRESLEDVDMDLAEEEDTPPAAIIQPVAQPEVEVPAAASSVSAKRVEQQEAARAEIREIEEKLQRKKQKKISAVKTGEIEDGECIDSEEDEIPEPEPAPSLPAPAGPSTQPQASSKEPLDEVKDRHREDQRKRWCDDRKSERRGREDRDRESYYRYDRRDRDRGPPPHSRQSYYEYDHRQQRY